MNNCPEPDSAWTEEARRSTPHAKFYAEKLAVSPSTIAEAGIPLRVIDLVRDPRDVLPSIRAFTARGIDGFGRRPGIDEGEHLETFIERYTTALSEMAAPMPQASIESGCDTRILCSILGLKQRALGSGLE